MADIMGIDLGTTNSEVAALVNGKVKVLAADGEEIMPSYVGLSLRGSCSSALQRATSTFSIEPAVKSIKRRWVRTNEVVLGEQTILPAEISALILRALKAQPRPLGGLR